MAVGDGDKREAVKRPAIQGDKRDMPVSSIMSETMVVRVSIVGLTSPKRSLYLIQLFI